MHLHMHMHTHMHTHTHKHTWHTCMHVQAHACSTDAVVGFGCMIAAVYGMQMHMTSGTTLAQPRIRGAILTKRETQMVSLWDG